MKNPAFFPTWLRIAALFTAILQWQCSHYYYAPTLPNVPTLQGKSDHYFSISTAIQERSSGIQAQVAYSPVDQVALGGDFGYYSGSEREQSGEPYGSGKGYMAGISGGWYRFYPTAGHSEWGWHLMALGGLGLGGVQNKYYDYSYTNSGPHYLSGTSNLRFSHVYLQPSAGWTAPNFELILSWRHVWLRYNKIDFNTVSGVDAGDGDIIAEHRSQLLFEPAGTLRFGWKRFKFQIQAAFVTNAKIPVADTNVGVGLLFYPGRE